MEIWQYDSGSIALVLVTCPVTGKAQLLMPISLLDLFRWFLNLLELVHRRSTHDLLRQQVSLLHHTLMDWRMAVRFNIAHKSPIIICQVASLAANDQSATVIDHVFHSYR